LDSRSLLQPLQAHDAVPRWHRDGSVLWLVAVNAVALALALWQDWNAATLMALYWVQSVIIGASNVVRMLSLERFSTEGFRVNGRAVQPTPATRRQTAFFFALHFGFFHVVYLVFLGVGRGGAPALDPWFWLATGGFALNHLWSYRYNRALDRAGTPNIGTLMFTPYLRIIPMHLTIIFGGMFVHNTLTLLLFGVLKTGADVGMHLVEHAQWRKLRAAPDAPVATDATETPRVQSVGSRTKP
jgi:hypothetical protein